MASEGNPRREVFVTCPSPHCTNELRLMLEKVHNNDKVQKQTGCLESYKIVGGDRRCVTWHNHAPEWRKREVEIEDFLFEEINEAWHQAGLVKNQPTHPRMA